MEVIEQAMHLSKDGHFDEAIKKLQSYTHEANDEERLVIAEIFHEWGLLNDAKMIYEDMLVHHPHEHEIRLSLAEIYTDLNDDEAVLEVLHEIDPSEPAYVPALVQLADLYQTQGLFEVAEQKLFEAKDIEPEEPIIDFALAELSFSNGEYQKAIPFYEKVIKHQDEFTFVDVKERLAECLSSVGNWEEALKYFQQIKLETPDALFKYGYTAYQLERYDISVHSWNQLLDLDPEYTSVYPYLAKAYEAEGALPEAYDILVKGINKDKHNKELFYTIAMIALRLDRYEQAEDYLQQSIAIDPGYEDAIEELITLFFEQEKWEQAQELVEELMKYEGYPEVVNWYGAKIFNELEEFDKSKELFEKAYPSFKDHSKFLREYGFFLIEEGEHEKAKPVLIDYLKIEPEDEEVQEFLGRMDEGK
ncbi:hypothetical protein CEY16_03570 [Halalkalibacillus sediminis]|uniref:Uncharacterized protein n=1 Tax=Halalkalibacillus sediminis TaxID=2018042 RepID=A0A2I0QX11_9BACI|nr:tetratricopeptide repeat protein [Halalkalibacillus sediminis]PKR78845.1 hypothetical protein CEY16_03570 [Halalkalibacillus sediminis]